jgi:dTDP-4-amino-4,6-dideoxygalactose transaminase
MDSIQAAVLRIKLKHLDQWTDMRIENAEEYDELLKDKDVIIPFIRENSKHVYHLYVIRVTDRDELKNKLENNNISAGIHYPIPLHLQPAYDYLDYKKGDFPVTEKVSEEILSLPMWPEINTNNLSKINKIIIKFYEER